MHNTKSTREQSAAEAVSPLSATQHMRPRRVGIKIQSHVKAGGQTAPW
jgi:hypothetical protein